jgi:DNA-binding HxlR family transcriptional regulator/putative sterol carrier protein
MESVATRSYGQFCGVARALELVGERWALLIVRDLLVGPRRFTDLRQGLPRIPTNVLSDRLKELEQTGIVRRRVLPRPAASIVYELTEYGSQLEAVLVPLGLWGAQSLGEPRPDEIITVDSMITALRSTFVREAAHGQKVSYELRLGGVVLHARVEDGTVTVREGPLANADLAIEAGPGIKDLMSGALSPADAVAGGSVRLTGDPALLERFVEMFRIPTRPSPLAA